MSPTLASPTSPETDDLAAVATDLPARLPAGVRRIPNLANICIAGAQLAGIFACFFAAGHVASGWAFAGLCGGFALLMVSVYSILHEAEHGMLFSNWRMNVTGGVVAAAFFPGPFHLLRQGHIGHHLRNRSDDEAFDLWFAGESPIWKWMQWIGILTGLFYLMVVLSNVIVLMLPILMSRKWLSFDRPGAAFADALNPKYHRIIRAEAIANICLHAAIIWLLRIPPWRYAALYATFGWLWSAMQYVHHYATERHITRGTRNLWLFWPIDKLWLNHNWHRVHHEHPTISWIFLERIGRQADGDKRWFLPWMYLKMWAGPRRAEQHVENRFAGKVIR
jgi:fatty acid desaturase